MKNKLSLLLFFLCHFAWAQIPTNGLIAYYKLNGNALDNSGNNLNGTITGANATSDRYNNSNSAYLFGGAGQVDCGTSPLFNIDECSISVWFYATTVNNNYQTIVARYDVNNYGPFALAMNYNYINMWFTTSTGSVVAFNGNTVVQPHLWYHVVVTHSVANGVKMYVNGVLDGSSNSVFNVYQSGVDHLRIGSQGSFLPVPFNNGKIDNVRIYNWAVDTASVTALYNEDACNQTFMDTVITNITVYDTVTTNITLYDTTYIAVTDTLIINVLLTGQIPPNNSNIIKVYPNPTSSYIYIDYGNFANMSGYSISIQNNIGQVVFNAPINAQQSYIDLSNWTGIGTYFVYLTDNFANTISIKKIILQ